MEEIDIQAPEDTGETTSSGETLEVTGGEQGEALPEPVPRRGVELTKQKTALITGIRGQDGAYLAEHLLERGYTVVGADRRSGSFDNWRMQALGIADEIEIKYLDLLEEENIRTVLGETDPELVFNLAAQSFVGVSFDQPILTNAVNGHGVVKLMTVMRALQLVREMVGSQVRFYQASTSEMFGDTPEPATEDTPMHPRSPYGVSKLHAYWITRMYRETYGLWACNGILFNHESPLRGEEFVTRKITKAVAEISEGVRTAPLELGNLDARRDWGHAKDYTEAMCLMMESGQPDDYVVASGESHTVREFVEAAFAVTGCKLEWDGEGVTEVGRDAGQDDKRAILVRVNPQFYRPQDINVLTGNASKARAVLDWEPKTSFEKLVEDMVLADQDRCNISGILE